MRIKNQKQKITSLIIIVFFLSAGLVPAEETIIELKFKTPPVSDSDVSRTLQSLVKVQGTGQFCQDGLYLITHYGDRGNLFQKENQKAIDRPWKYDTWRFCSVFSATSGNSVVMGRNWDNQNVGSIIVSLYHPPGGYASISISRSIDLGFGHKDLEEFVPSPFANKLLLAPFYAYDGINENGLTAAVAGVRQTAVRPKDYKKMVFVSFLVRKILDQCKNIQEAVSLAENFVPFDLDVHSLNTHFLIADSSGRSVILEYDHDQWRTMYPPKKWQVLTNKRVYHSTDIQLKEKCWRYRHLSEALERSSNRLDWTAGLEMLQNVAQKGTTWSVIYSPVSKEIHFSVYQNWGTIYHIKENP